LTIVEFGGRELNILPAIYPPTQSKNNEGPFYFKLLLI
jgi:hypothetical protein